MCAPEPETTRPALSASSSINDIRTLSDYEAVVEPRSEQVQSPRTKAVEVSTHTAIRDLSAASRAPSTESNKGATSSPALSSDVDEIKPDLEGQEEERPPLTSSSISTPEPTLPPRPEPISFIRTIDGAFVPVYDQQQLMMAGQPPFGLAAHVALVPPTNQVEQAIETPTPASLPYRRPTVADTARANAAATIANTVLRTPQRVDNVAPVEQAPSTPQVLSESRPPSFPLALRAPFQPRAQISFAMGRPNPESPNEVPFTDGPAVTPLPIFGPMMSDAPRTTPVQLYQFVPYPPNDQQRRLPWSPPPPLPEQIPPFVDHHHHDSSSPFSYSFSPTAGGLSFPPLAHGPPPAGTLTRRQKSLHF